MLKHEKFFITLRLLISSGLIFCLVLIVDWTKMGSLLVHIEKKFLFPPIVLLFMGLLFSAFRWKYLLSAIHLHPGLKVLFNGYMLGAVFSILLPGVVGGDLARIGLIAKITKKPFGIITSSVFLERICGVVVLLLMGSLAFSFFPADLIVAMGEMEERLLLFFMGMGCFFFLALYAVRNQLYVWLEAIRSQRRWLGKILESVRPFLGFPAKNLWLAIFLSVLSQSLDISACFFLAKALGLQVPFILFFAFMPLVYLGTMLPISIGGLGVREGILVSLLSHAGIDTSEAITLSFLIHFNHIVVAAAGGIIYLCWPGRKLEGAQGKLSNSIEKNSPA